MDVEETRKLKWARPFRAFALIVQDGRRFPVDHPDYLALDPAAESVTIFEKESNFAETIDIFAVVSARHEVAA